AAETSAGRSRIPGGGGGIGMTVCRSPAELRAAYDRVTRLAEQSFGSGGVFAERYVEHARHVEVQIFGDGLGGVVSLGDRDCTLQRRHQKVVEEAPAPGLPSALRERLHESARALAASVRYRSAGTVEFVYDPVREEASFLEVNARLQVEHPVTEAVTGIDLVAWMLRLAGGDTGLLRRWGTSVPVRGHAIEARVYAEDPAAGFQPSAGLLTGVALPSGPAVRVDGWVETGTEVSTAYDPLLAKVIVHADDRADAIDRLGAALADTRIDGVEVNLGLLRAIPALPAFRDVTHHTTTLDTVGDPAPRITVRRPGLLTTVQDADGRLGYWQVGVPPSGAMDDRSLRAGNRILGNDPNAAGLECTATGPALAFSAATTVCVTGAPAPVSVDGVAVPMWTPVDVPAGATLDVGAATTGLRTYVCFAGGLDVPLYLGSAATFTLGKFGGHGGRALRPGDVLRPGAATGTPGAPITAPEFGSHWELTVAIGPHGAPEFFTPADMKEILSARFEVHFNSARTGVRLIGPKPAWARRDGGEAGLHPSNIHDNAYAIGALDFTGDTPILLGPDGPSLGGFVCPVTVVTADRWKLGQLRPGDTVSFVPLPDEKPAPLRDFVPSGDDGILLRRDGTPSVTYRRSGDDNVLVEYGEIVLDLGLRARVHALHQALDALGEPGIVDLTPGIRSLQVHVDPRRLPVSRLLGLLTEVEDTLPAGSGLVVPSRHVRLPLSWDDPATREAIARYMAGVRDDAPWTPWNIEFIRRINGLATVDDVYRTVFDAEYLVLGLGDVYLGAPVATPLDPRHRLVTTKYNPARTWTAENSVGIGGAYLCIYGMEGPGGYQFVGRTTQVWRPYPRRGERPWLLDFFDRISWYPVSPEELLDLRADLAAGRTTPDITDGTFSLAEHEAFLAEHADAIAAFRRTQAAAFATERAAWEAAGEFDRADAVVPVADAVVPVADAVVPPGGTRVDAPFVANVWKVEVAVGDVVAAGQTLVVLEAMKMETFVEAPAAGVVTAVLAAPGAQVAPGDALVVIGPA
ncbi:urea carboxylase, partial [Actinoplanes sp. RD1]|uniref:urea carboxylase n=1 Tax=Actinoplanes sp. RD1 TaxID=3064538 RepID=UPI00274130F1